MISTEQSLNLDVPPEQIRLQLKPRDGYVWQVDKTVAHLFTKGLNKLSVGAYDQLIAGINKSFTASLVEGSEKTLTDACEEISRLEEKLLYWRELSMSEGRARIASEEKVRSLEAILEIHQAREKEYKTFLIHIGQAVTGQIFLAQSQNSRTIKVY